MNNPEKVILGRLGSVHGVQGWLKVISFTDPIDNIFNFKPWQIEHQAQWQTMTVASHKRLGNSLIVKLHNLDDREIARTYTNDHIAIPASALPTLQEDEHYWSDLIGLEVYTNQQQYLGVIDHLLETGSNDVFVIKGEKEHLIPYTRHVVQTIDLNKRTMIVDWDPEF